jgi:hypothetical protein
MEVFQNGVQESCSSKHAWYRNSALAEIKIDHEHLIGGIGFVQNIEILDVTLQLIARRLDEQENGFVPYFQTQAASWEQLFSPFMCLNDANFEF